MVRMKDGKKGRNKPEGTAGTNLQKSEGTGSFREGPAGGKFGLCIGSSSDTGGRGKVGATRGDPG